MKFRFCGELDCPDWILAEIADLSKITSIKLRILCQQVINQILDQDWQIEKVTKVASESGFDNSIMKGMLAALEFIFVSSAKNLCDSRNLGSELEQLGLPSEHSTQLCKIYDAKHTDIQEHLKSKSFMFPDAEISNFYIHKDPVDKAKSFPVLDLTIHHPEKDKSISVAVESNKLNALSKELSDALSIMQQLNAERI